MENFELYLIAGLIVFTLWFIFNTKKFYFGEKRKVKNLHRFAKEGEAEAQQKLALYYQKGEMVKKNCDKAAFWYQKAAFSGDEKAKGYLQKFLEKHRKSKNKC
jgi:TPR repeat protein